MKKAAGTGGSSRQAERFNLRLFRAQEAGL